MRNAIDAFILQRLQEKGIVPGAEADKITLLRREKAGRFGRMGQRPTHSELVDWLADEFVRSGWRLKRMHRLMVTSAAYRPSSLYREDAHRLDPMNRLLWRSHEHLALDTPLWP